MSTIEPEPPPIDLAVVGENRSNPDELLLLGENGHYYAYSVSADDTVPVEPDEDWQIETTDTDELFP